MSDQPQILNIGTLVLKKLVDADGNPIVSKKTGEPVVDENGNPLEVYEVKLRQNVDIQVNGKTVNFRGYSLKDGTELKSKVLSLTAVDKEIESLNKREEEGKVPAETAQSIRDSYERDNVQFTLKVSSANQA